MAVNGSSVGIVLRHFSHIHNKIALLDKQHGRIECIVNKLDKPAGSLLGYTTSVKRGSFFLNECAILYVPLDLARADLLFLHHILELIYYFAPVGSCVQGVFDLIAFLYTIEHMLISVRFKKFFLFKLLTLLGVAPELDSVQIVCVRELHTMTIDMFDDAGMNKDNEKKLDKWLWSCIWQHPYVSEFKTVHFLEKNRAI